MNRSDKASDMGKPVSVSVIIPFYNEIGWLSEAIGSVLRQTYPIHEIIVINDGSKEDVSALLNLYEGKIRYFYKENGGPSSARNLGIDLATGDYLSFLDSDDVWLPTKTEKQIKYMIKREAVWSHTAYETFDTVDGRTVKQVDIGKYDGMIFPKMLYSNPLATPSIIIKRDVLLKNPSWRFNEKMRYGQDQYLWMCIAQNYNICAMNEILTKVRMRGSNAALRARVQLRAKALIYNYIIKGNVENVKEISASGMLAFKICTKGEKLLSVVERKLKKDWIIELCARLLYFVPWTFFKMNARKAS